jgi:outer membrane murein-binding lipoprotein Lpp
MRHLVRSSFLSIAVMGAAGLIAGCSNESNKPEAKTAENALGIPGDKVTKDVKETRDVKVVTDTKVIDTKTGQTISEKKEETPVKVTRETQEKVKVEANVGATKSTTTGEKMPLAK